MQTLKVELENCYGIRKLSHELDFSDCRAFAIYAPNGVMKTSLAKTFGDLAKNAHTSDRIFPTRTCVRKITDEQGGDIPAANVLVVQPFDETFGNSEKTATLLVNAGLRKEYESIYKEIEGAKRTFLKALKDQSGSKRDLEKEVSSAFTRSPDKFERALFRIRDEVLAQKEAPFANIEYDTIFDDKVVAFLETGDFRTAIGDYIKKYNELLAASIYFKQGTFTYYNASTIARSLAENGFFAAKHTVLLNGKDRLEIQDETQLAELIAQEKEGISKDKELKAKFAAIEKLLTKNVNMRGFDAYISAHEEVLANLANIGQFKEDVWKSYCVANKASYTDLLDKYAAAEERLNKIQEAAKAEQTQWQNVIDIFNDRFVVPFRLQAKNRIEVICGQDKILTLGFTFEEGGDSIAVERESLMQVLSTGEKKALYVLNIIFEVEVRKKDKQETIFVVDDIADSFDYKNKYAIIEYLKEIAEEPNFKLVILTHNFDFFRTINSRFIRYSHCLMASKSSSGLHLQQASGIRNIFINDWKTQFFKDVLKRNASIPFVRNLVEYTKGPKDPAFACLTSLLHWKSDTLKITQRQLDDLYNATFSESGAWSSPQDLVFDAIQKSANECLKAQDGANFENKIVLSIAIRLMAEKFMSEKINDATFLAAIDANQTAILFTKFRELFAAEKSSLEILQKVILMTPESIHLNSFMYEPIVDMSDEHLRRLYRSVVDLK